MHESNRPPARVTRMHPPAQALKSRSASRRDKRSNSSRFRNPKRQRGEVGAPTQVIPSLTLRVTIEPQTQVQKAQVRPESAIGLALVALCAWSALCGCDRLAPARKPPPAASQPAGPPRVTTSEVLRQDLEQTIEIPGTIEGYETADLYAKVGGYLGEIHVDIGDRVEADQVLAKLSVPELEKELAQKEAAIESARAQLVQSEAAVRQAMSSVVSAKAMVEEANTLVKEKKSQLKFRQAEFDRTRGLVQSGSMLAKRLDEARYQLEAAEAATQTTRARGRTAAANLEATRLNVEKANADRASALAAIAVAQADAERTTAMMQYTTIRAPFTGVVIKRMADTGSFIQSADGNSAARPLVTVTRTDVVRVTLDLPMQEVRWLDQGDQAVLENVAVLPDEQFVGQVARFSPSLDPTSRMMRVEVDLQNPQHRLLPGYYGTVRLRLAQLPQTPVVPTSALMSDQQGSYVYVVEKDTCVRRRIETNYADGLIAGVASGLDGGEQVVITGGGQLTEGQAVTAVERKDDG